MTTWLTSDQHFYHRNVILYCNRPYAPDHEFLNKNISDDSVNKMNEDLVRKFNELVKPGDIVYHLGDFSLAHRAVTVFLPRLNGEHHLIAGNHDHCHPAHYGKKEERGQNMRKLYYEAGFKTIKLHDTIEIDGKKVNLCHLPYAGGGDHTSKGERYTQYRLPKEGSFLLHGHVHTEWLKKGNMINVGVDMHDYYPISLDKVIEIMKTDGDIDVNPRSSKVG